MVVPREERWEYCIAEKQGEEQGCGDNSGQEKNKNKVRGNLSGKMFKCQIAFSLFDYVFEGK